MDRNYFFFSTLSRTLVVLAGFSLSVEAADPANLSAAVAAPAAPLTNVSYNPSNDPQMPNRSRPLKNDTLVFSAPPRETPEKGKERYEPIAQYLSKVTGKKIVYKHPGTWGVYRTKMLKGNYDLVFDGPHFNSYRAEKLNHNILAKIAKMHEFVIIVKKSNTKFNNLHALTGRTFCTHAPPNLGTLTLLSLFDNPMRQPVIINTKGWDNIYKDVVSGKCVAGILPILNLKKFESKGVNTRVVFKAKTLPNQAFSAGPRITRGDQQMIAKALVSKDAAEPTAKLRATYKVGKSFALTSNQEYTGISKFLRNEWGYY